MRMEHIAGLAIGICLGLASWAMGQAQPADPVAAVIAQVRAGMTSREVERVVERLLPEQQYESYRFVSGTEESVLGTYALDAETTLVLHYGKDTDVNIPEDAKITAVEVNHFADLKGEVPAQLYEHVRLIQHLSPLKREKYDPAALIRVINDLQPLGKQKALEALRAYERLGGDELLLVWKEGQDQEAAYEKMERQRTRAMRYGINLDDERLLPIPGLLFVAKDGEPFRSVSEEGRYFHPVVLWDDIPFVTEFIENIAGAPPHMENEIGPVEEEMRIRPTLLRPKGDPLSAAESLLASPAWRKLFQNTGRTDEVNRDDAAKSANTVRLQALRMIRPPVARALPWSEEEKKINALWQDSLKRPELRELRWDATRQEFARPGGRGRE